MKKVSAREKGSGYDSRKHGRRSANAPPDDRTINPAFANDVNVMRPSYDDGPTVIRIFPHLSYTEPETKLQPGRLAAEPGAYSEFMVRCEIAKYVGIKGGPTYTFIMRDPRDEDAKSTNPYRVFYRACAQAYSTSQFGNSKQWDSRWNPLMTGKKGSGAPIGKPSAYYFVQGACFIRGDKDYMEDRDKPIGLGANDDLCVIQLPDSAGRGLIKLFDVEKPQYDQEKANTNFNEPFVFGSPTGVFKAKERVISGGWLVTIFNPKKTKIEGDHSSWNGEIKDVQGYEAAIAKQWKHNGTLYTPDLDSSDVDQIFKKSRYWFDDDDSNDPGLLRFAPYEEQARWIAEAFRATPRLVAWAFADNPEFLTEEVKGILAQKTQASVPSDTDDDEGTTPAGDSEDEVEEAPPTRKTKVDPSVRNVGKKVAATEDEAEDEADEFADAKPKKKTKPVADEEEEEEEAEAAPAPKKKPKPAEDEEEEEEAEEGEAAETEEEEEEEEEEAEESTPPSKKKPKPAEDEEEEEEASPPPKKRPKPAVEEEEEEPEKPVRKTGKTVAKPKVTTPDEDEFAPDEDADDEEEAEEAPKKKNKPASVEDYEEYAATGATKKSLEAAEAAGQRSAKRKTPEAPPPTASKGGAAKKKPK